MPQWAISGTVYLAAALMIYNIYCFVRFAQRVRAMEAWKRNSQILYIPIVLLTLFFFGYLVIGFFGKPNLGRRRYPVWRQRFRICDVPAVEQHHPAYH